jgi:hypothetical protein
VYYSTLGWSVIKCNEEEEEEVQYLASLDEEVVVLDHTPD